MELGVELELDNCSFREESEVRLVTVYLVLVHDSRDIPGSEGLK